MKKASTPAPALPCAKPNSDDLSVLAGPDYLAITRRHLRYGWWSLLIFLTGGIILEGFHGLKAGFYLNPSQSTRRLMWTLAHAHGTMFGLVNVGFAFTTQLLTGWKERSAALASTCLISASI